MIKPTALGAMIKELAPVALQIVTQLFLRNISGFQGFVLKIILQYGGRQILDAINDMVLRHDRAEEQREAEKKKNEVVSSPDSSIEQIGEAYEEYYNSGRSPSSEQLQKPAALP